MSESAMGGAAVSRADLYSHLLTRQTGRAVRLGIERQLHVRSGPLVTLLDFREVQIIDFSCADEVVAKLAHAVLEDDRSCYLLVTGVEEHHRDPVESALRRRGVAIAGERADGSPVLLGELELPARRAWEVVVGRKGGVGPAPVAASMGLEVAEARGLLDGLHRRRLVYRRSERFLSIREAVGEPGRDGG